MSRYEEFLDKNKSKNAKISVIGHVVMCVGHKQIIDEMKSKDSSDKVLFDPRNMMPELKTKTKKYVGLTG